MTDKTKPNVAKALGAVLGRAATENAGAVVATCRRINQLTLETTMRPLSLALALGLLVPSVSNAQQYILDQNGIFQAFGGPGGIAQLGTDGTLGASKVQPLVPSPATRTLADRARDQITVRDFIPAVDCTGATNSSVAMSAIAIAMRDTGRTVYVPSDCRIMLGNGPSIWQRGMHFAGEMSREMGPATGGGTYGSMGATILLTSTSASPFVWSDGAGLEGLHFVWPGQTEAAAAANGNAPLAFPPLVSVHENDRVLGFDFDNNQVENAYDMLDLTAASGAGFGHVERNMVFAIRYAVRLANVPDETWIRANQFTPGAQVNALLDTSGILRTAAAATGEVVHVQGNGTIQAAPTMLVEGLQVSDNYAFAIGYGVRVVGGGLVGARIGNNGWDSVPTPLSATQGGWLSDVNVTGDVFACQHAYQSAPQTCVDVEGAAPGNDLTLTGLKFPYATGAGIVFKDSGAGHLSLIGAQMPYLGFIASGNPYAGIDAETGAGGSVTLVGNTIVNTPSVNPNANGIVLNSPDTIVSGNHISNWLFPIYNAATAGQQVVVGNLSTGSAAPIGLRAIQGAGAAITSEAGNQWDLGANVAAIVDGSGSAGIECKGATATVGCSVTTKGQAGIVINSGVGTVAAIGPADGNAQNSYVKITSGSGGTSTIGTNAGNLLIQPAGIIYIPGVSIPQCSAVPTGYMCVNGSGAGAAIVVK